ncbi:hypothetical protein GCM10022393_22090 [Aquimarina addita]|uniref:Toxin-antitoxin system YwqK family antitoxin n=1 Tax=Aquimarina addita TaxID=870485 RepID=A0ABP6ULT4_9FLAO
MRNICVLLIFIVNATVSFAQNYNAYDAEGRRHGKWQKKYENSNQLRYEGVFDHGKEVGVFKFYKPSSGELPTAIKTFSKTTDTVQVQYFTNKKKVISEGAMIGKNRVGLWVYYHQNSTDTMMREMYRSGKLNGDQITYFENGKIAEKTTYVDGKKEGKSAVYSDKGILIKEFTYENDQLHGPTKYYDIKGKVKIEGDYKRDKKNGLWKYYENGKLLEQKVFPLNQR